jgi:hypothetical protein
MDVAMVADDTVRGRLRLHHSAASRKRKLDHKNKSDERMPSEIPNSVIENAVKNNDVMPMQAKCSFLGGANQASQNDRLVRSAKRLPMYIGPL